MNSVINLLPKITFVNGQNIENSSCFSNGFKGHILNMSSLLSFIKENIDSESDNAFHVLNVEDVIRKHQKWTELMPRVVPHFAVKANPFPVLLRLMVGMGLHFDCASKFEIETMLELGAKPEDIIFANPCKSNSFISYSKSVSIDLMTFDNEEELAKVSALYPSARLVLRIKVDDSSSSVKLGLKFGADLSKVEYLLSRAKCLSLNVIGIAFHVGSGCQSAEPFAKAIQMARIAFDIGLKLGFDMTLLDIGGGYPGSDINHNKKISSKIATFEEIASVVNQSLDQYFPEKHLQVMAEPGRYYSESAFTLVTRIISKNIVESNDSTDEKIVMYYLNDGTYGSFSDALIDKRIYKPIPLVKCNQSLRNVCKSTLWGPTCDSYDCIRTNFSMPEMNVGEWLLFEDMGCYSLPFSRYGFNGMPSPNSKIFISNFAENYLMKSKDWPKIQSFCADFDRTNIYSEKAWYQMG